MRFVRRSLLALSLTLAFVPFSLAQQAAARRAAVPRCPRAHPADGAACTVERQACHYGGREEGDTYVHCGCRRGEDDMVRWRCHTGQALE